MAVHQPTAQLEFIRSSNVLTSLPYLFGTRLIAYSLKAVMVRL
jgi:hypothetical protein